MKCISVNYILNSALDFMMDMISIVISAVWAQKPTQKRDYRLLRSKERAIVPYFYSNVYNCFLMNNVQGINIFQA